MSSSKQLSSINLSLPCFTHNPQSKQLDPKYSVFLLSKIEAMADVEIDDDNSSINDSSFIYYGSNIFNSTNDYIEIQNLTNAIH